MKHGMAFSSITSLAARMRFGHGTHTPHPTMADLVEGCCFAALAAAIAHAVATGTYTSLATPRAKPYLVVTAILLGLMAVAACIGMLHTATTDVRKSPRWLVALIIPALLISVPFHQSAGSGGFDAYASGRAIPIAKNVYTPTTQGICTDWTRSAG